MTWKGVEQAALVQKVGEDRPMGGRGLVDDVVRTPINRAGTSASRADDITRQTVKRDDKPSWYQC